MSEVLNLSRRRFMKSSALAGGGLVLGVYLPQLAKRARGAEGAPAAAAAKSFQPNAFVRIGADDTVTVICNHSEMGQGAYTSLAMLAAEDLEADWSKVRVEGAPVDAAYNHTGFPIQMVGGSTSTWTEWERLRKAGATAKVMLIAAAAAAWQVEAANCTAQRSRVKHDASGRELSYGELVAAAAKLQPPQDVQLKDPKDFKIIGKPTKRLDTPEKVNGKGLFGLDVNRPGMLTAVVARSPTFGGKVKRYRDDKAKAMPGVRHVVEIPRGVAVVADGYWQALKARQALDIEWDAGPQGGLDSAAQLAEYAKLAEKQGAVARNEGDVAAALAGAAKRLAAVYEMPYLAHAPMEPMNCVAEVRDDGCEVWTGTQFQTGDRAAAAEEAGLKPEQVQVHTMWLGGGFGRRTAPDSHMVREAVQVSKAVRAPVKVVWSREDDTRGGYYRPAAYHKVWGGLDAAGNAVAWQQRIVCQSFMVGTPFEALMVKDGVDAVAVEGVKELPYEIANLAVDWQQAPPVVPTLWWRSVGHSHTAFATESFVDELAHGAGKDPLEFRRGLLAKHPRDLRVLELAAEKAGWGQPLPPGRGRGIAVHESFGSFVAQVAEVSVSDEGRVRVHRVVCAIDCGPTVNPDGVHAQMESGIVFGLTAALYGAITFAGGQVQQRNFHDYPMLRMNEMPVVEAHIVPSTDTMGGVGETGVPPVAPAVCNAIFAVTGKRVRRLPIRPEELRTA